MSEAPWYHQVQCILSTCWSCHAHWIRCHYIGNRSRSVIQSVNPFPFSPSFSLTWHPSHPRRPLDRRYLWPKIVNRKMLVRPQTLFTILHTVKIPLRWSSSSTTSTESLRFAAINWEASITSIVSFTVNACAGRRADTVPAILRYCCCFWTGDVRFLESSRSNFCRMAYEKQDERRQSAWPFVHDEWLTSSRLLCRCRPVFLSVSLILGTGNWGFFKGMR